MLWSLPRTEHSSALPLFGKGNKPGAQSTDAVTQFRGLFKFQIARGLAHFLFQLEHQGCRILGGERRRISLDVGFTIAAPLAPALGRIVIHIQRIQRRFKTFCRTPGRDVVLFVVGRLLGATAACFVHGGLHGGRHLVGIENHPALGIARGTAGFAGADLENLLNEAAIMATRSKRRFIMQADIDEAILKVVMGPEKKSRVVSERARRLTAYHESGHAIASFFLKNSDPVHYITIIPRGAAGGFTWYRKAEDAENFTSRGEMFDSIVSALGGRIAEQLFLDDISTGASNDIQQATNIARDMVMKYGMSEKLGPISFDDSSHSIFIGRDFGTTKSYSEETAATIDEEVKHLFDQAYAKCEALLREHADLLTGLAEYLLIHETIEGDDFRYYCEHGVMPVHPDDTIEPPAKVIRRMDEAPETPQPDAEAPAQPEAPSAPDADAPNSDPGEQL